MNVCFRCGTPPLFILMTVAHAQDLAPRAYLVAPKGSSAVTISWSFNDGQLLFEPSIPIEEGKARFQTQVVSAFRSFGLFGRSSNIVVSLPYAVGNFQGVVLGQFISVRRSGMVDARVRFSINLRGGRAMQLDEFAKWNERSLIGASVTAVVPTGQNDPHRVVNPGTNRWAVKPEIGMTRRRGRWVGEGYGGVWLFAANPKFYPGDSRRVQSPMAAFESHLGYYVKRSLWASLDGNFWTGGRSSLNGSPKQDRQKASRIGITVSVPFQRHQSMKFSYSRGAYVSIGGNYQTVTVAWQYTMLGKRR